ncbi:Beta-lactamase [Pseudoalteromonas sp. 3J6]|uniref:penicillin binding protein PBP4B n=1 Tax=unclassified Pseudoalteromonas TaxID=194690 RepID=UPI0015BC1652|nr:MULTISPECIES: penicillin binding protein PBP4B [unclassified Pseudoalteromonas]NWL14317.1 penicillin binding protein PBP4B [Pseudoalteromonas sp. Scap03]QLE82334.1 penicillin binding protein PBP4B [Pseudoalteromonas sp. Scap25]QLE90276.1 penicillin binding protein PBP4B [Pseudoalteromonas sp. Scap06]CAD2225615.1 Beta-lactamase [Pseudoalteromonas sp. 3J6]
MYLNFSVLAKRTFFNALTITLCFIITGCSGASSAIKSQRPFIPNQIQSLANAQVIATFPESNPSSREYVNNRGTFKAYKGRGQLLLQNESALSADIYINNKKLALDTLQKNTEYAFNLGQYTHNGVNTFKVDNIQPANGSLTLRFAFATLNSSVAKTIDFSAVDKLIEKDVSAGFPGAVLAIIKAGKILKLTAYGDAKQYQQNDLMLLRPEPMQTNTLFDLASNTKIFATNFALMKLVSEGQLNINNRVSDYLTEYQGDGRELRQVKDLLTHKAGYPPVFDFHRKDTRYGEAFFSQASDTTKQLLLTSVPLASEPSAQHVYSDIDYMILGVLIERISGQPLDEYLEQHIYAPLKLNNTLFNPLKKGFNRQQFAATELSGNTRDGRIHFDNIRTNVLQGQVHDERAFYSLDGVAGHAGLFSNAPDLAVLCQVLLNKGGYGDKQIFNASSLAQFLTPQSTDETYGLGFRLAGNNQARRWHFGPYASPQAYGHTGWTGTVTVIDPAYDLAIVLLTNARHSPIKGSEKRYQFVGKNFETAQYGSIVSLIYEALLNQ